MSNFPNIKLSSAMESAYLKQSEKTPMSRCLWAMTQLIPKLDGEEKRELQCALYNYGYVMVKQGNKLILMSNMFIPENPYEKN